MTSSRALALIAPMALVALVACGKESTPPELSRPAKLLIVSGDAQSVPGPLALTTPLVVRVLDPKERSVANVIITWAASDAGASLSAASDTSDAKGEASVRWTLGPSPGLQTVTAAASSFAGVSAVFQATNTVPTKLTVVSGDDQIGDAGAALSQPLVARLTDVFDRPVSGATVTWTASGGGSLSPATTTSDAQGTASATWTLSPTPGVQAATATSAGPPVARAVFRASNGPSISGGVTITPGTLWSLGNSSTATALASRASTRVTTRGVLQRRPTQALARDGEGVTRRLIVEFKPAAAGLNAHIASGTAAVQSSLQTMRAALAPFAARGLVSEPEVSPVILATRVTVTEGVTVTEAMAALRDDPAVASVSVDEIVPMLEEYVATEFTPSAKPAPSSFANVGGAVPGVLPNDPLLASQYWHYNMVDAPRAWARGTGNTSVLVAVVDNGIRFEHPAITANLTSDGYNFVTAGNRLSSPQPWCTGGTTQLTEAGYGPDPTAPDDVFQSFTSQGLCWSHSTGGNHGLHVAGTIGAVGNDGVGGTGLNWAARIRPVRVLDITGSGSWFDVAQGVLYAAGLPASDGSGGTVTAPSRAAVINMSLGGGFSSVMQSAVTAATNAGSLIIASAGNSQTSSLSYPASYPEVVSVVALGPDLQLASYTNVGTAVSVSAPGGSFRFTSSAGVLSSTWNFVTGAANYSYYQGTSMAAPHVTGVAALVLAANPSLTNLQLRARLQETAIDLGPPGRDNRFGYGLVNAYNAVANAVGPTRAVRVRLVDWLTGSTVQSVAARSDGTFAFSRLTPGTYAVYAGQDEAGDALVGVPGRRWGWYGPAGTPAPLTITSTQNAFAPISIGLPVESEPNNNSTSANRLVINGYVAGQITNPDVGDYYLLQIPIAGTYYLETTGIVGSCGFGLELDTVLTLFDAQGGVLASNDDTTFPSSERCSAITRALTAGTYYLRVTGFGTSQGQYRLWAREEP
jgi:subtilisin family serine protease